MHTTAKLKFPVCARTYDRAKIKFPAIVGNSLCTISFTFPMAQIAVNVHVAFKSSYAVSTRKQYVITVCPHKLYISVPSSDAH